MRGMPLQRNVLIKERWYNSDTVLVHGWLVPNNGTMVQFYHAINSSYGSRHNGTVQWYHRLGHVTMVPFSGTIAWVMPQWYHSVICHTAIINVQFTVQFMASTPSGFNTVLKIEVPNEDDVNWCYLLTFRELSQ